MHESGIARRLVTQALEAAGGEVTDVEIVLGAAAGLDPDALREHFAMAARGTPAERAELRVTWETCRYQCLECGREFASSAREATCPSCGGFALGQEREDIAYVRSVGGSRAG